MLQSKQYTHKISLQSLTEPFQLNHEYQGENEFVTLPFKKEGEKEGNAS